ncbi:hypothetical protein [Kiloniella sp.]|uniref:hypothetical protein n=1 Tax=Kiloniella sp. TaxID=1938587 RepID=UPI003B0262CB
MKIKSVLQNYIQLQSSNWETLTVLSNVDTTGSFLIDWQQANWELLVEGFLGKIGLVLECYGEGADCNGASSRVLFPEQLPTHKLICTPTENLPLQDHLNDQILSSPNVEITFDRFVTLGSDGWYKEAPPFDKILGDYHGAEVIVDFEIRLINS